MEKIDELKEVGIKIFRCYYFDDISKVENLIVIIFYQSKNHMKIF